MSKQITQITQTTLEEQNMSNIHKRIRFVKRIQLPCVKIIIWPRDINFVIKRRYSLVVITCNYVFSDLSLQLHTKGKNS